MSDASASPEQLQNLARWTKLARAALYLNAVFPAIAEGAVFLLLLHEGANLTFEGASQLTLAYSVSVFAVLALGGAMFLGWLRAAYRVGISLTQSPVLRKHKASGLVSAFLVPIVNLVRPYFVMQALHETVDPSDLLATQLPAILRKESTLAGYRDSALEPRVFQPAPKRAPVKFWWGLWVSRLLLSLAARLEPTSRALDVFALVADAAAAIVCAVVVARVTARIAAYAQRLSWIQEGPSDGSTLSPM